MAQEQRRSGRAISTKAQRWAGLCLGALGVFLFAALLTYNAGAYGAALDRGEVLFPFASRLVAFAEGLNLPNGPAAGLYHNAGGGLGLLVAAGALGALGWVVVWVVPVALLAWGWNRLLLRPVRPLLLRSAAAVPLTATLAALATVALPGSGWGGMVGSGIWQGIDGAVGPVGGFLALATAGVGFFFLEAEAFDGRRGVFTRAALTKLARGLRALVRGALRAAVAVLLWVRRRPWEGGASVSAREDLEEEWSPRIVNHDAEEAKETAPVARESRSAPPPVTRAPVAPRATPNVGVHPAVASAAATRSTAPATQPTPSGRTPTDHTPPMVPKPAVQAPAPAPAPHVEPARAAASPSAEGPPPLIRTHPEGIDGAGQDVEDAVMEARLRATPGRAATVKKKRGTMTLPPLDILDHVPDTGPPVAEKELKDNSKILTATLSDFAISGKVGEVHPGPVITRYEYIPGPGVRVSQILNRQDDLALKLRASRIRILAPIPGKAAVGIEVPNRKPAPIFLRRLLESKAFQSLTGPLPLALGKNIGGAPVTAELSKMPHLLIAGTTGSGKSVCMNALITSLLVKRTPAELRLLMIDPKMLELPMYNGIPHLLSEVVTDPKVAVRSFRWALIEMETRYKILAARGCRNLASYNAKFDKEGPLQEGEEKLPYIVILIDELADLMMTGGREVEEPVARLAQTARAVGIHLIVATQRPSVDVITGIIKANFPCRIAFQVASRTDSRTILDQNGAESLLGKGDMLFLPPGQAAPVRVHGAFVSEEETQRLAEAWRLQGAPEQCAALEEVLAEPETGVGALGDDPLFEDAARLVVVAGQASASLLQRRLKVGYARAARLVDMLEAAGVVAPSEGSKAREVLVDEVNLEHVLAAADK